MELSGWLIAIPARLASERLPRKPLADLGGLPMIVRVFRNLAPLAARGATIIVAADSGEVLKACAAAGVRAELTDPGHQSGTDRTAEVAARHPHYPYVLNVQGDEPFIDCDDLMTLIKDMKDRPEADLGTLTFQSQDQELAADPNAVKAVRAADGHALYFSRAPLPYTRGTRQGLPPTFWHHLGIYAFRRDRLLAFVALGPSALEMAEKLEQLRALEHGWRIHLAVAKRFSRGIDTPADLEAARARFRS